MRRAQCGGEGVGAGGRVGVGLEKGRERREEGVFSAEGRRARLQPAHPGGVLARQPRHEECAPPRAGVHGAEEAGLADAEEIGEVRLLRGVVWFPGGVSEASGVATSRGGAGPRAREGGCEEGGGGGGDY